jgi:hypothetical protein
MNKVIAYVLMVIGSITALGGFVDEAFFTMFWGGVMGLGGYAILKNSQKAIAGGNNYRNLPNPNQKFEMTDEMILRLAQRFGKGKLSVEDLISQTSLNREQAQERLDKLLAKGMCQIRLDEIGDDGKIYYYF